MGEKAKYLIMIIVIFSVGAILLVTHLSKSSGQQEIYDQQEVANPHFKLRITGSKEKGVFLPGVVFVCQTASIQSNDWQEIMTIKADEPRLIRGEQLQFANDNIGYIFVSSFLMVTTDGGKNWVIWDGEKYLQDEQYKQRNLSPYIEEVKIESDGKGTMTLYRYFSERERGPNLYTEDYGHHWFVKP
jgi:hypothetical protein